MRLVTFTESNQTRIGLWEIESATILDIAVVAPDLPQDMLSIIELGEEALHKLKDILHVLHWNPGKLKVKQLLLQVIKLWLQKNVRVKCIVPRGCVQP